MMDDEPDPTQRTTKDMAKKMAQERAAFLRNEQQQKILDSQQTEVKMSLLEQHLVDMKRKMDEEAEESNEEDGNPKKRKRSEKDKDKDHKKKKSKHSDKKSKKDKHKKHKKSKKDKDSKKDKKEKKDKEPKKMEPYWDRERDLDATKFNDKRRNAIIQSSAALNERFDNSSFL